MLRNMLSKHGIQSPSAHVQTGHGPVLPVTLVWRRTASLENVGLSLSERPRFEGMRLRVVDTGAFFWPRHMCTGLHPEIQIHAHLWVHP